MAVSRDICGECGHVVLRLSWSQLRTHEECRQKRHLQQQGKRATLNDQRAFFPGNVTDRVVRDWLRNTPGEKGLMPEMVSLIIDREKDIIEAKGEVMKWKNRGDRSEVERDCIEAVTKIEPALLKYVTPFEFQADFKFQASLNLPHPMGGTEKVLLIGFMDIIVKDDQGRWWVWDVKHTRDGGYWRKTVGQLSFYDFAVELMFGQPTVRTGLLQPLCKQMVLPYEVTPDKRAQLRQRVAGMATDIWRKDFTPRADNKMCTYCDVKHACPKFEPVLVNGKKRVAF